MIFRRRRNRAVIAATQPKPTKPAFFEPLEQRTLLSGTVQPDSVFLRDSTSSATVTGYTPAQIEAAYGFSSANFSNSSISADGSGQTIAIIDAYNDPNISNDLAVFDAEFSLPSASLKVVNQTGGSKLPSTDAGWAGEISLDVEWAHAIAPGADILLVEASSDSTDDLMAAVNYARNVTSVSVVSMSWGGSEYFDWGNGGESTSQTQLDADFTTPSGHQGITFIAAAGDSGTQSGVQWPASSPNVLAVGGTTLTLQSDGTYGSESGWAGTSGGYSQVESEPAYQEVAQNTFARSVPDVAYDADPNTGFAVYDSVADEGVSGWQEVGGTSAGAPQWAALIAIADQGRTLAGKSTLDGATQTLPDLYDLYSTPSSSTYDTYTSYFNDILNENSGPGGFRWGGRFRSNGSTGEGYDTITGLGTPHAGSVIDALMGDASTSNGTTANGSGGTTTPVTPSAQPASPVSVTFLNTPVVSVIAGSASSIKVDLTNVSGANFKGPVTVLLYATTTGVISSSDTPVATLELTSLSLKTAKSKVYNLKFTFPSDLATGNYYLIATAQATATNDATAQATSTSTTAVTAQSVDLSTTFAKQTAVTLIQGKNGAVELLIKNLGNVSAIGYLSLALYASTTGVVDTSAELLNTITNKRISIGVGKTLKIAVKFKAPTDLIPAATAWWPLQRLPLRRWTLIAATTPRCCQRRASCLM